MQVSTCSFVNDIVGSFVRKTGIRAHIFRKKVCDYGKDAITVPERTATSYKFAGYVGLRIRMPGRVEGFEHLRCKIEHRACKLEEAVSGSDGSCRQRRPPDHEGLVPIPTRTGAHSNDPYVSDQRIACPATQVCIPGLSSSLFTMPYPLIHLQVQSDPPHGILSTVQRRVHRSLRGRIFGARLEFENQTGGFKCIRIR